MGKKKEVVQPEETCYGCKEQVVGGMIKAMDQWWHKECFVCYKCGKSFPGGKFVRFEKQPYCKKCADKLRSNFSTGGSRPSTRKKKDVRNAGVKSRAMEEFGLLALYGINIVLFAHIVPQSSLVANLCVIKTKNHIVIKNALR